MITLHYLNKSRSFRVLWLLEELGVHYGTAFKLVLYERTKLGLAPKNLQNIHPMGKAPILVDDSLPIGEQTLIESAMIIEYLLKTYDKNKIFLPTTHKSWRDYTLFLHFAESTLMPPLVMDMILRKSTKSSFFVVRPVINRLQRTLNKLLLSDTINESLALINRQLTDNAFICGDKLTGADCQLYVCVLAAKKQNRLTSYVHINRWLMACESRKPFIRAKASIGDIL